MLRFLYNLFREQFNRYAFEAQARPLDFEGWEVSHIDSNGKTYYKPYDILNQFTPIRIERISELVKEMKAGLDDDELERFVLTGLELCNGTDKFFRNKVTTLFVEMANRRQKILKEELLIELACVSTMREDEKGGFDIAIHKEKCEQLKKDIQVGSGLYDFFYNSGLTEHLPHFPNTKEELEQSLKGSGTYLRESQQRMNRLSPLNFPLEKTAEKSL